MKPIVGTLSGLACGLLLVVCSAYGHEHHNANGTSQDYSTWKQPGTKDVSCCNNHDCQPVDYRFVRGRLQFFLYDQWVTIPERVILHDAVVTDRNAHWCGKFTGATITHFCAVYPKGEVSLPPRVHFAHAH